jgi:hypothetical protein
MSLPRLFGTTLETVPAAIPYLFADPARVAHWRQELAREPGLRVGIAWQGNPNYPGDHHRSMPLAVFAPLAAVPGVRLFSLQKGFGSEQLPALADRFPVVDLGNVPGGLDEAAAIIMNLDLVIACDTSLIHLAGALGVRAWIAVQPAPNFRWLLGRNDSPWYPTVRIFRQSQLGNWPEVFARIASELRELSAGRA